MEEFGRFRKPSPGDLNDSLGVTALEALGAAAGRGQR